MITSSSSGRLWKSQNVAEIGNCALIVTPAAGNKVYNPAMDAQERHQSDGAQQLRCDPPATPGVALLPPTHTRKDKTLRGLQFLHLY